MTLGYWSKAVGVLACGAVLIVLGSVQPVGAGDAPAVYTAKCQSCHGPAGKGDGPAGKSLKPPASDLTDAANAKLKTADEITNLIKKGGKEVGLAPIHAPMPKLTDEEIAALVKYTEDLRK